MIPSDALKPLDGGLYASIIHYNQSAPHSVSLTAVLREIISHEAMIHGAPFDEKGFKKVMGALADGDIEASFFLAAWDVCRPKIVGATITIPTVSMQCDASGLTVSRARHSEDVCLLPSAIRQLISERPEGRTFPESGLGAFFERESVAEMVRKGEVQRYGEFALRNTKIKRILSQSGTLLGNEADSALLKLNTPTQAMRNRWPVEVDTSELSGGDGVLKNSFITSWSSQRGGQRVALSLTNSISTFTGGSVAQARFVSTPELPTVAELKDIVTSLILEGHQKIAEMKWGLELETFKPSPIVPLNASVKEITHAILSASQNELVDRRPKRSFIFGGFSPETHLPVQAQPKIIAAMRELDIPDRVLGAGRMMPGILNIEARRPSRPLEVLPMRSSGKPMFDLAA